MLDVRANIIKYFSAAMCISSAVLDLKGNSTTFRVLFDRRNKWTEVKKAQLQNKEMSNFHSTFTGVRERC